MSNGSDSLDRLRKANPVPSGLSTLPAPDPVLLHRIVSGETVAPRKRAAAPTPRRARRLVPALLGFSLVGGAVAYAVLRDGVSKPQRVACYEHEDLESRTEVVRVDERGPLEACADLWRGGVLGPGREVPPLVDCVLDTGVAGVFPSRLGGDVCRRLGLATVQSTEPPPPAPPGSTPPPQSQADVNARFLAFRDAVVAQFLDTPCVDPTTGAAIVRRELAAAGLGDWTVRGGGGVPGGGSSAARPCVTLAFEPEDRQVVLVPAPSRP